MAVVIGLNVQEREVSAAEGIPAADVGNVGAVFQAERGPPRTAVRLRSRADVLKFGEPNRQFSSHYCLRGLFENAGTLGTTVYGSRVAVTGMVGPFPARLENLGPPNRPPQLLVPVPSVGLVSGSYPNWTVTVPVGQPLDTALVAVDQDGSDTLSISATVIGGSTTPAALGFSTAFPLADPAPGPTTHQLTVFGTAAGAGSVILSVTVADGRGGTDAITVTFTTGTVVDAWAAAAFSGTAVFGEGESPGGVRQGETFLTAGGPGTGVALARYNSDGTLNLTRQVTSSGARAGVTSMDDLAAVLAGDFVTTAGFPAAGGGTTTVSTSVPGNRGMFLARARPLDGRFVWVRPLDPGNLRSRWWAASGVGDGTFLASGVFSGALSVPAESGPDLTPTSPVGSVAYLLARLNGSGLAQWTQTVAFGGNDPDTVPALPVVSALGTGEAVLCWNDRTTPGSGGTFGGVLWGLGAVQHLITFGLGGGGGGPGSGLAPIGNPRARAALYSAAGALQWSWVVTHPVAAFSGSEVVSCAAIPGGGAFVVGAVMGGASYQFPTAGSPIGVSPTGLSDAFAALLDASGNTTWVVTWGAAGTSARATSVASVAGGGCALTFSFTGSVTVTTVSGPVVLTATGSGENVAVLRLNSSGVALWARLVAGV